MMNLTKAWECYKSDKHMQGYSSHTLKSYQIQFNLLFRHLGDVEITGIDQDILRGYIAKDFDRLMPSSVGHRIKFIKSLFRWLHDEGMIDRNITSKFKEPKQGRRLPKMMEKDEIELLKIECKTKRDHALVRMLYATGCRIGELVKLNIADLDLEQRTVVVNGKGDKERTVFFNASCKMWLQAYINSRTDNCEALFVTERAPRRATTATLRGSIKQVAKRTGIDKSIYPHRFRHSFASHMFAADAPLDLVQELLGHAKADTTRIYIAADPARKKQLYDRYN